MMAKLPQLLIATLAGLLACGLMLWPIPYREVSLPGNPSAAQLLLTGALAGILAGVVIRPGPKLPILSVAFGFVLAVMGRVEVETSRDPTSHNLRPFEVVIVGGIGLAAAALGVGLARLVQRQMTNQ
jgi:hypothetical protein